MAWAIELKRLVNIGWFRRWQALTPICTSLREFVVSKAEFHRGNFWESENKYLIVKL